MWPKWHFYTYEIILKGPCTLCFELWKCSHHQVRKPGLTPWLIRDCVEEGPSSQLAPGPRWEGKAFVCPLALMELPDGCSGVSDPSEARRRTTVLSTTIESGELLNHSYKLLCLGVFLCNDTYLIPESGWYCVQLEMRGIGFGTRQWAESGNWCRDSWRQMKGLPMLLPTI